MEKYNRCHNGKGIHNDVRPLGEGDRKKTESIKQHSYVSFEILGKNCKKKLQKDQTSSISRGEKVGDTYVFAKWVNCKLLNEGGGYLKKERKQTTNTNVRQREGEPGKSEQLSDLSGTVQTTTTNAQEQKGCPNKKCEKVNNSGGSE